LSLLSSSRAVLSWSQETAAVRVRRLAQCRGISHASAPPSATTASATNASVGDGSVASAAASSLQPSAAVSAGQRRSRASITAMTTSSRCKTSQAVAAVSIAAVLAVLSCVWAPGGGAYRSVPSRCRGAAVHARPRLGNATAAGRAHAVPHSRGAAQLGGEWRTRAACAAHQQYAMRAAQGRRASPACNRNNLRCEYSEYQCAQRSARRRPDMQHLRQGPAQTDPFSIEPMQVPRRMWEDRAQPRGRCATGRARSLVTGDVYSQCRNGKGGLSRPQC
jgi:hypothetical protein